MDDYMDMWTYKCSISTTGNQDLVILEELVETLEEQKYRQADVIVESEIYLEKEEIQEKDKVKEKEEENKTSAKECSKEFIEPEFPAEYLEETKRVEEYWKVAKKYLRMLQERRQTRYTCSSRAEV
jgi:hypothetical protein